MNDRAVIGGNNPPQDPIDELTAQYADVIEEAGNWLDGEDVETEAQMDTVDGLISELRTAGTDMDKARLLATKPMRDAVSKENARWKVTIDDIDRRKKGLVAAVSKFKDKLAAKKEAEKRAAYAEAKRLEREAEEAANANAANYDAQVKADRLKREAIEAKKAASAANKDTVKGMRTVHKHELTDPKAALNWIAKNDRAATMAFIEDYVRKNSKTAPIDGVKTWTERGAY